MEATEENCNTVADVAKVRAVLRTDSAERTLALVKACTDAGAIVEVHIHHAEQQAPTERYESVSVGGTNWRRDVLVPAGMPLDEQDAYIKARAIGAATAYAEGLVIVAKAEADAKAGKGAK